MLKPSTERCMILLHLSVVETVTITVSIDMLNVIGIVFLTETSVVPSALEISVTVVDHVSAVAVVDSSSSLDSCDCDSLDTFESLDSLSLDALSPELESSAITAHAVSERK